MGGIDLGAVVFKADLLTKKTELRFCNIAEALGKNVIITAGHLVGYAERFLG